MLTTVITANEDIVVAVTETIPHIKLPLPEICRPDYADVLIRH